MNYSPNQANKWPNKSNLRSCPAVFRLLEYQKKSIKNSVIQRNCDLSCFLVTIFVIYKIDVISGYMTLNIDMNDIKNADAPRVSLEHWRALVAVVDEGGYAKAAVKQSESEGP